MSNLYATKLKFIKKTEIILIVPAELRPPPEKRKGYGRYAPLTRSRSDGTQIWKYHEDLALINWVHETMINKGRSQKDKADVLKQFMSEYMYTTIGDNQIVDFRWYAKQRMYQKTMNRPHSIPQPIQGDRMGRELFDWFVKFVNYYNQSYKLGVPFGEMPVGGSPRTQPEQFQ